MKKYFSRTAKRQSPRAYGFLSGMLSIEFGWNGLFFLKKNGEITYYQQMLGAAIVHPDFREVIPLAPEPIIKQEGQKKINVETS